MNEHAKLRTQRKPRPAIQMTLTCACGGTLSGTISPPAGAVRLCDAFLSLHADEGCKVTAKCKDVMV